jgi:hypothetical protein
MRDTRVLPFAFKTSLPLVGTTGPLDECNAAFPMTSKPDRLSNVENAVSPTFVFLCSLLSWGSIKLGKKRQIVLLFAFYRSFSRFKLSEVFMLISDK